MHAGSAINSHLMLMGWSPMIREVLLTKRMPPEQVDPFIGHFDNARYISEEDLQTLVHWIDAGSPRGSAVADPLAELSFPDHDEWQLGEPDYIIKAPVHEIPATGVLDYMNVDVELPFDEDKWVRAVQFVPGDRSVLHHLLTYVTAPAENFLETAQSWTSLGSRPECLAASPTAERTRSSLSEACGMGRRGRRLDRLDWRR